MKVIKENYKPNNLEYVLNNRTFPDGTEIDCWFLDDKELLPETLGKEYVVTNYGIIPNGEKCTQELQMLIDAVHCNGGGILVFPYGEFLTGPLFFKEGVHLCVKKGCTIKGSDNILDYPIMRTRIEGESCLYFPALINADGVSSFCIFGGGVIDGNGEKSWKAFWRRREWNPDCTNKDEQRPRLLYISNSSNITISNIEFKNSHFWTTHIYKCNHVYYNGVSFYSPCSPVWAPSTDGIDIDVCTDVHIKNCYFEVCDDAIALKGGKGYWANINEDNGKNDRIIIEDCTFGFCTACLTLGSESFHSKNVIFRRARMDKPLSILQIKIRLDTPQIFEKICVENIEGKSYNFLTFKSWDQFFKMEQGYELPKKTVQDIYVSNINVECDTCFNCDFDETICRTENIYFSNLNVIKTNQQTRENYKHFHLNNVIFI